MRNRRNLSVRKNRLTTVRISRTVRDMSENLTLFDRFGGTRKMAAHLGESPSTVQSWKTAGRVPAGKQPDVLAKAIELGLQITAEDIIFPLGRENTAIDAVPSPTKTDELIRSQLGAPDNSAGNICEAAQPVETRREADSPSPFSGGSPSTSSTTGEPKSTQPESPSFSTLMADSADQGSLPLSSQSKAA